MSPLFVVVVQNRHCLPTNYGNLVRYLVFYILSYQILFMSVFLLVSYRNIYFPIMKYIVYQQILNSTSVQSLVHVSIQVELQEHILCPILMYGLKFFLPKKDMFTQILLCLYSGYHQTLSSH